MKLSDILSKNEIEFVKAVCISPGTKYPAHSVDNAGVYLYERPERLGLIKAVGSYKWEPTDKIRLTVELVEDINWLEQIEEHKI